MGGCVGLLLQPPAASGYRMLRMTAADYPHPQGPHGPLPIHYFKCTPPSHKEMSFRLGSDYSFIFFLVGFIFFPKIVILSIWYHTHSIHSVIGI